MIVLLLTSLVVIPSITQASVVKRPTKFFSEIDEEFKQQLQLCNSEDEFAPCACKVSSTNTEVVIKFAFKIGKC